MDNNPNNIHIDDTSLVTCAEYQLFLDDQSAQGHHYQPWHWTSNTFQTGHGHEPILGVQPSDIQAFCEWLTARENGLWHYRLPHKDELAPLLAHLKNAGPSPHAVGFWAEVDESAGKRQGPSSATLIMPSPLAKKGNTFAWLNGTIPEYENLQEMVVDQLLLDRAQALAYDRVHVRDFTDPIDTILELERQLNDEQVPDISPLLVQNIKIQPLDFNIYYNLPSPPYDTYIDLIKHPLLIQRARQLYWLIRYWSHVQARRYYYQLSQINKSQKRQQRSKRQKYLEESLALEKSLARESFEVYKRICIDFTLLELRTQGKLPPWEGILLVKEHK